MTVKLADEIGIVQVQNITMPTPRMVIITSKGVGGLNI